MAVTEPRSAHYEAARNDAEPPSGGPPVQERRRRPGRRRTLLGLGALLAAAVTVFGVLAGTYQPLGFGGQWAIGNGYFPGLPNGTGLRSVNTFGSQTGQDYVPPQAGVFTVVESIDNNGPEPVTIEAVSILSPDRQVDAASGESPWPVVPAGPVRWRLQIEGLSYGGPVSGRSVTGFTLRPGQDILLGFPLRLAGGGVCYTPGGWTGLDTFYVKERFGPFTRWVTVQFPEPLMMREPPSVSSRQSHDLTCPPGVSPRF